MVTSTASTLSVRFISTNLPTGAETIGRSSTRPHSTVLARCLCPVVDKMAERARVDLQSNSSSLEPAVSCVAISSMPVNKDAHAKNLDDLDLENSMDIGELTHKERERF